MDAIFSRVLQTSVSGSIVILAVLVLRLILQKAPKRAVCLLWMLAVLRLLVPFELQSNWSLQPELAEFAWPVAQEEYFNSGTVVSPVPPAYLGDAVEYPMPEQPPKEEPAERLAWLWTAGAAALAVHGAVSLLRLKKRIREAVILEEGVWVCPGLDTAFVLGFFRPRVYLPVLEHEERALVLRHERQHIRRGDHWWKPLAYAAVSLHWFNPLAWVTYVLLCRDMELACDQETVREMDHAERRAYSAALLRCAVKRSGIAACPVAFGEISVKERIKMVLNYKKPGVGVTIIALLAAIAVGFFLLTSPKEQTDLERCEEGLREWQALEVYQFRQNQTSVGEDVLVEFSQSDFWSADGEHLKKFSYAEELGDWLHWKDGKAHQYQFGSLDADWEDVGWQEIQAREDEVIPWIMRLDWDQLTVRSCEPSDDGKTVLLTVDFPTLGPGTLCFYFEDDRALSVVSRTFADVNSTVCTTTIALVETDRAEIEKDLENFGVDSAQGMYHLH